MYDAVVVAGGAARRFGGADKIALEVAGRSLLDTALDAVEGARAVVVVGPERPLRPRARVLCRVREQPPGSGPLAGIAAGVRALDGLPGPDGRADAVVVLAADLPFVTAATVDRLLDALGSDPRAGAAAVADAAGRVQLLTAAYDGEALRRALATVGDPAGRPVRRLLDALSVVTVEDPRAARDCDTPEQLADARRELEEPT